MNRENLRSVFETSDLGSQLNEEQITRVLESSEIRELQQGELLCNAGEKLPSLFVVLSGCVCATVITKGKKQILGFLNSGQSIGYFDVVNDEPTNLSSHAEFETSLLAIPKELMLQLQLESPKIGQKLTRELLLRVRDVLSNKRLRRFAKRIGFVSFGQSEFEEVVSSVAAQLKERGERLVFVTQNAKKWASKDEFETTEFVGHKSDYFSQLDRQYDRIFVEIDPSNDEVFQRQLDDCFEVLWFFDTERELREQTKLINAITRNNDALKLKIKRVCLLKNGLRVAPIEFVDNSYEKSAIFMQSKVDSPRLYQAGIGRIFRHLCDIKIGISLAGGGARGLVHFGVLRALDRAGISFDLMSGTSAGSMFGLSYASGMSPDLCIEEYRRVLTPSRLFRWLRNGHSWYMFWKFRTRAWEKMLRPHFFDWTIEQLQFPFSSCSVDLVSGKVFVSDSGDMVNAMMASLNIPGISRPILRDGMALVDGGVLNNLPTDVLAQKGAALVLGVNVSGEIKQEFGKNKPEMKTSEMRNASTLETMFRVIDIMGRGSSQNHNDANDMIICPDASEFSFTDFTKGVPLAEIGEAAMEQGLPELRSRLNELFKYESSSG